MMTAPPDWLTDRGTEQEALIREARRRQRRRWLGAGVAAATVLAAAAMTIAGSQTGSRPGPPGGQASPLAPAHKARPTAIPQSGPVLAGADTTVLMWPVGYPAFGPNSAPAAYGDDLSTGRLSRRQIPGIAGCDCQPYLIVDGKRIVYVGSAGTMAVASDLLGQPRAVGDTGFFAPSATPGRVWLLRFLGGHLGEGPVRTWSAPLSGGAASPALTLPAGAKLLIRGTDGGLLMQGRPGQIYRLALWTPGSAPRNLPGSRESGISDGFDATARLVAYGSGCQTRETAPSAGSAGYDVCAILRVFNVVTGRLWSFPAPPGAAGWTPRGFNTVSAISPGDQMIAAYALTGPARRGRVRLYVVRLGGPGHVTVVPSSAALLASHTAWSVKGSWLLYQGPGERLWAYQVSSGRTRKSSTPCCLYAVMVAAPDRSG